MPTSTTALEPGMSSVTVKAIVPLNDGLALVGVTLTLADPIPDETETPRSVGSGLFTTKLIPNGSDAANVCVGLEVVGKSSDAGLTDIPPDATSTVTSAVCP